MGLPSSRNTLSGTTKGDDSFLKSWVAESLPAAVSWGPAVENGVGEIHAFERYPNDAGPHIEC